MATLHGEQHTRSEAHVRQVFSLAGVLGRPHLCSALQGSWAGHTCMPLMHVGTVCPCTLHTYLLRFLYYAPYDCR